MRSLDGRIISDEIKVDLFLLVSLQGEILVPLLLCQTCQALHHYLVNYFQVCSLHPSSNLFAPKTPGFGSTGFGTSSSAFSSSSFGASTTPSLFQSSSLSTPSVFGSTYAFGSCSSPSPFSSSSPGFGQSVFSSSQVQGSTPAFSSSLFSSSAPSIGQAGAAFVQSTSSFGQTATGFDQSSLFSTPSTGFGNLFSSSPSIGTSTNPLGFSPTAVSTSQI